MTHHLGRHRLARRTAWLRPTAFVVPILLLIGWLVTPIAVGAAAFAPALTRAPYLTDLVSLHVNVNWATNQSSTSGQLKWGPLSNGSCKLNNNLNLTPTSVTVGTVPEYQWKASLSLPSTGTYCYRPLLAGVDLLATNPTPQFKTQVATSDTTPFSFDVFGDWGQVDSTGANPDQAALYSKIAASGARFAVSVGDNGYPNGSQINYGDLQQTGPDTSAVFGPSFWTVAGSTIPLFPAAGNHGLSGTTHTDITTWTEDTAVSSSGGRYQNDVYCCVNGSSSANYASEWYAFNAGPARFYMLDSAWGDSNIGTGSVYANDAAAHFIPGNPEYTWLLNDLKTHPSTLKFAFFHYPLYSDNPSQPSDTYLEGLNNLEGLLGQYGVDVVFNGHAHIYERNLPSAVGMPVSYITGAGGSTLEPIGPCHSYDAYGVGWSPTKLTGTACGAATPPTAASNVFNFLKVTVSGSTVTVTPTDETGRTFDVQTYTFTNVPDTVIDSAPPALTNLSTASFAFHSTRILGATYKCSLDGAPATSCTSPASYSGLGSGAHTFSVAATTADGTDLTPATASWTVDVVPPSTPTNLVATAQSPTSVALSWTAATDNFSVASYDVQRNGVTIGSTGSAATNYLDTTAAPATGYQYAVIARDSAGNASAPSAPASVTTPASTGLPTLVQSAASSTTTVTLPGTSAPGDLLVLTAGVFTGATKPITAVTDGSNTWTKAGSYFVSGQNSDGELWYAAHAAPVRTITVTTTAPVALQAQEFTNMAAGSLLDGATGTAASSRTPSSGSLTPTIGNDLAIGFVAGHTNAQTINVTSPGYTLLPQQTTTGTSTVSVVTGSQVLSGTTPQAFTASLSNTMYWADGLALFKAATPPNDFSLSASPSSLSVVAGQGGSSLISSTVTSGNAQPIALAASGLPAGTTASFDTTSITAGQSATLTLSTSGSTPPGSYPITVTGAGSSATHTATVTLTVTAPPPDDFSLSASPSSLSVVAGQGGSSLISSAVTSGNAQPIALAASGLPAGTTASFDTSSITAGQSATLTLSTSGSTPPGSYPITVTGAGSSATHTVTVTLTVTAPPPPDDFSIAANPTTVSVVAGQGGSSLISSTVTSGNAQPIALAASGLPAGTTASFDTSNITAGQSATLTLSTSGSTPPGSYPITVTGTGSSATHTVTVTLTVTAQPPPDDFSVAANPTTLSVTAGQGGTSTISTAVISGNPQTVALTSSGAPAGASVSFNPASITAGQSSTATITTSASIPPGSYPITITGTGSSATHGISITLTVTAPPPDDFSLSASPSSLSVVAGQGGSSLISSAVTSGNPQPIALAASGLPAGTTASFDTTNITAGQSATLTLTTSGSTPAGSYPITVTGTGSSATHTATVTLTVTAPPPPDDFSLSASPSSLSVVAGQGGSSLISSAVTSGNPQPIALAASGLPTGATGSFDTTNITAGQSATLTLTTSGSTPAGSYPITVTGAGSSATHTTTVTLTVTAGTSPGPRLVQAAGATEASSSTTLTATLPAASTGGDLLVLSASVYTGATNHISSVTDSAGNVWQRANAWSTASHNSDGEVWYTAGALPATSVVAHLATGVTMAIEVQEFSGIVTSNALDTSVGASNTGTTAASGPLTPAGSGELLIGLVAGHANAQAMTVTSTGFTLQPQQNSTGTIATVLTGYQVLAGTTATGFNASFTTAMYWAAGIVAFKPS